jgi:hypothetical protein
MVGQRPLKPLIGVRIPVGQLFVAPLLRAFGLVEVEFVQLAYTP